MKKGSMRRYGKHTPAMLASALDIASRHEGEMADPEKREAVLEKILDSAVLKLIDDLPDLSDQEWEELGVRCRHPRDLIRAVLSSKFVREPAPKPAPKPAPAPAPAAQVMAKTRSIEDDIPPFEKVTVERDSSAKVMAVIVDGIRFFKGPVSTKAVQ